MSLFSDLDDDTLHAVTVMTTVSRVAVMEVIRDYADAVGPTIAAHLLMDCAIELVTTMNPDESEES